MRPLHLPDKETRASPWRLRSRNHRHFHLIGLLQDLVSEIQAGKPASRRFCAAIQENLGDAVLARIVDQGLRAVVAVNDLSGNVQILGEAEMAIDGWPVLRVHGGRLLLGVDIHRDTDGLQMVGDATRPA